MKYFLSWLLGSALLACSSLAPAAVSEADLEALRAEFSALSQRITALEAENAALKAANEQTLQELDFNRQEVAVVKEKAGAASWTESVRIKGDFRYRMEGIDEAEDPTRDRSRIRARAAIIADISETMEVGMGFATGGDSPVSANQTLGGGGSTKDLRLDLAYLDWSATENLHIVAGKFKNIWHRPQKHGLMWDSDWNPEGFGFTWSPGSLYLNGVGTFLEGDSKSTNTEFSYGFQGGFNGNIGAAKLVAGGGYYLLETKGKSPFFGDADDFFGNSFACADPVELTGCVYLYNYEMVQGFADLSMSVGDMPLSLFADYVRNLDAEEFDTGYAVGVKLGKVKGAGTWDLTYAWQDLEADAVLGLLTDSNFGGGGTDATGHVFKGFYGVTSKWSIGVTYFNNRIDANAGDEQNYDRLIFDTKFKY